ncbi:hypothetical protein LCGC14_2715130 [marine sediment metagenome]|uniref:Uncharacterized protein n=1 Tax=marine sediment metagenome TaxID=412755 RepID=A0A0F8ZBM8_9ZZZZ|nr:hypothetical protein [Candidatus Scalindua sp.]
MTKIIKKYDLEKPMQMVKMATILKNHIVKNKLYAEIAGKNYVMVEGWQFAGGLMGLFPKVAKIEDLGGGKWLAKVEIIDRRDGAVISVGFALCSKAEMKKKTFDEYAILSMAQTRAIGKAYRNLLGWVMKLAGYEGTPAEEIKPVKESKTAPTKTAAILNGKKVEELKKELKGNTAAEKIADLKKRTSIKIVSFNITDRHAGILLVTLLTSKTKR